MAEAPKDLPRNRARIVSVEEPTSGHYVVAVLVDPLRSKTAPPWRTTLAATGLLPQGDLLITPLGGGTSVDISGYVLTDIKPDESGANQIWLFEKLPGPVYSGKEVSTQFGGGVLTTSIQSVAPNTAVTGGLRVVEAALKPAGGGKSVLQKSVLPDGESWPTLKSSEFDQGSGLLVDTEKTVVAAATAQGSIVSGVVTEIQPLDKWRSIQIVGKFNPSTPVGTDTVIGGLRSSFTFPDVLTSVSWLEALARRGNRVAFDFAMQTGITAGYSGPCEARLTERVDLVAGAPVGWTYTEFKPRPRREVIGCTVAGVTVDSMRASALTIVIPETLHGALTITEPFAALVGNADTSRAIKSTTSILATSPTDNPASGTWILKDLTTERWRFGHYIHRMLEIKCP